jgi:hypothetical protein
LTASLQSTNKHIGSRSLYKLLFIKADEMENRQLWWISQQSCECG